MWVGIRLHYFPHILSLKLSAGLEDQKNTPPLLSSILLGKKYFYCIKACVYACMHIYNLRI